MDTLCATQDKAAMLECSHHHTLCHNGETIRTRQLTGLCWNATPHACHDVFLTKPQLSTALYQTTDRIISEMSVLGARGISLVRFASRFHIFLNSRMSEHHHRGGKSRVQRCMACFRHCCHNDLWWMTCQTCQGWQETQCTQEKQKKRAWIPGPSETTGTHTYRCADPRHTMPPHFPQYKPPRAPRAPRGRWHVHKQ